MRIQGAKKIHNATGPNMPPLLDVVMGPRISLMLFGSLAGESNCLMSKQCIKKTGGNYRPLKQGEVPDTPIEIRVDNSRDGLGFVATGTGMQPTNRAADIE